MKKRILKKKAKEAIMEVFKLKNDREFREWLKNPLKGKYSDPLLNIPAGMFSVNYGRPAFHSFAGIAF